LLALMTWADRTKVALADIEVSRPTLEDVFLELTGSDAAESTRGV
jgi:hypothetical protein